VTSAIVARSEFEALFVATEELLKGVGSGCKCKAYFSFLFIKLSYPLV
jgi:hypothetical protein